MRQLLFLAARPWDVPVAHAASKPHVMSFGKPSTVKLLLGPSEEKSLTISVRPRYLDTKF
jgi:hypothetical protein